MGEPRLPRRRLPLNANFGTGRPRDRDGSVTERTISYAPARWHFYTFSHQLVHQASVSSMSDLRRRLMHQRVVDRLETQLSSSEGAALELMRHAALAGQPDVAVRACIRAASRCVELFATKEAESLLRRGFAEVEVLDEQAAVPLTIQLFQVKLAARRPSDAARVIATLKELGSAPRRNRRTCRAAAGSSPRRN